MKVGDYVRTKRRTLQPPQIAKITNIERDSGYHNQYFITLDHNLIPTYNFHIYEEDIDKSSPDIIDLIEVGDYVNGMKVKDINNVASFVIVNTSSISENTIFNYNIKSILTKEQFKSMEYKIGE